MSEQLHALLDDLDRQRAELLVLSAPLKAMRAVLVAEIAPLEAKLREANQKIKALEQPKLGELLRSISGVESALGITGLRECCRDAANRQLVEKRDSITIEECTVCGRRHHTIEADPIRLGVSGAPLG